VLKFKRKFRRLKVNEIMWKNMIERGRPQMTIWLMDISN
jgi:hypothetical protein